MTPAGFELAVAASERPQTHALDIAATGIGLYGDTALKMYCCCIYMFSNSAQCTIQAYCIDSAVFMAFPVELQGITLKQAMTDCLNLEMCLLNTQNVSTFPMYLVNHMSK